MELFPCSQNAESEGRAESLRTQEFLTHEQPLPVSPVELLECGVTLLSPSWRLNHSSKE